MTRDPDPTPPHGIPRPPALAPTAIDVARGWLTAQDSDYLNEIGNGGVFDTLAQVLDLVEGFAASYFAEDAHGVDLYAQEAGALSVFRACANCRTWHDRADLDPFGLCEWCQEEEDEDEDGLHPCEHGHLDCATRPGGDCWQEVTPSPWERVADARRLPGGHDFAGTVCADCSAPLDELACPTCSEVDGLCCECCDCAVTTCEVCGRLAVPVDPEGWAADTCADCSPTDTPHPFGGALDR